MLSWWGGGRRGEGEHERSCKQMEAGIEFSELLEMTISPYRHRYVTHGTVRCHTQFFFLKKEEEWEKEIGL